MNWYRVVLLLVTIACIGAPMLYAFGIKEKEMHTNVKEIHDIQELRLENDKLRELASELYQQVLQDDAAWHDVRAWEDGLPSDCLHPIRSYDDSLGKYTAAPKFEPRMREFGIVVDDD